MAHTRRAEIEMLPTDGGGLRAPLQTPTRHLLLVFSAAPDALQIRADITTTGDEPLRPGETHSVQLAFWAPEAEDALAHREEFDLWAGRTVGSGRLSPDQP